MGFLANAALAGALLCGLGIGTAFVIYQRRLGRHRGVTRERFIAAFADVNEHMEIAATVYEHYTSQVIANEFSVSPDDELDAVFSMGDEDIDDDIVFLMRKLELHRPPGFVEARAETSIKTVRDVVSWLDWIRRHQANR